jgi:integrase
MQQDKLYRLYQRPGSPYWSYDIRIPGRKRLRRSTKLSERKEAKKIAARVALKEWKRYTDGEQSTLTFAEAVMLYEADGKHSDFLDALVDHFKNATVASIKPGSIRSAAKTLYPGRSPSTWNRNGIVPTRAVINHCAELGLCSHIKVRMFKESPPARRAANSDWLAKFTAHAPPNLAALALFMSTTGARIGQAIRLTWEDVNLQRAEAVIPPAKGFPERIAHLPPATVAALANITGHKARLKKHRRLNLVFGLVTRQVYRRWKDVCDDAGIPYLPTHQSGRHTFFTETIVRNKIDPKSAAQLGGSASPALLLRVYSHPENPDRVINDVFGTFGAQTAQSPSTLKPKNARKVK